MSTFTRKPRLQPHVEITATFLNAITAADNGGWVYTGDMLNGMHITVKGMSGDTIKVCVSNQPKTATMVATDHGVEFATLSSDGPVFVPGNPNWIKVYCSTRSAGTITAIGKGC